MKILLVAMNSIHFTRWTDQLKDSGHEVYWFNIYGTGYSNKIPWVEQVVDWKQKYPNFKGRHFIKHKVPFLYRCIQPLIENDTAKAFEKVLLEIQPDVVHSFVLYISCAPILEVMQKHKNLPWIYSSWGSDLFYFKEKPKYLKDIKNVLPRVNYLITDCKRDINLAKQLGFRGRVLGTFPGGGGFDFKLYEKYIVHPASERRTILVKGYQGRSGRCIKVLKALLAIAPDLKNYKVIVFGADTEVVQFSKHKKLEDCLNISVYARTKFLPHEDILRLMGEALIYVGNSNSDGMPNTLLEAIGMGAFPIQSNPGGATEEVIDNGINGFLISDCLDEDGIKHLILKALNNSKLIDKAFIVNQMEVKPNYERSKVKHHVLKAYQID